MGDTTGTVSGSFYRIGELKVEEGRMKYEICNKEGQVEEGNLGPVANPYRLVKYLAIRTERYSADTMSDLRLHSLGLLAGLSTTVEEPTGQDGTSEGATETADSAAEEQSFLNDLNNLMEQLVWWWEGWWPRIHTMISFSTPAGGSALMHVSVDLLLDFRVEDLEFDTPVDDEMTANQKEDWTNKISNAVVNEEGEREDFFRYLTGAFLFSFAVLSSTLLAFNNPAIAATLFCIMTAEYLIWLTGMWIAMRLGLISQEFILGLITLWFWSVVGVTAIALGAMILIAFINWATKSNPIEWMNARIYYGVLIILFQFALIAGAYYVFTTLAESSIQNYMAND